MTQKSMTRHADSRCICLKEGKWWDAGWGGGAEWGSHCTQLVYRSLPFKCSVWTTFQSSSSRSEFLKVTQLLWFNTSGNCNQAYCPVNAQLTRMQSGPTLTKFWWSTPISQANKTWLFFEPSAFVNQHRISFLFFWFHFLQRTMVGDWEFCPKLACPSSSVVPNCSTAVNLKVWSSTCRTSSFARLKPKVALIYRTTNAANNGLQDSKI